ncbi:DUF1810 domain-containing protein [Herminiimonas sp. CN]|uniref:DUF1810 domain-containing protein n=1 Tax=Herminiimonas sp. CN TaxID=1349818 RepID=UPI000473DE78|nr:DUF1810 domain-containing protein [Herminiimonas sp. CN]
MSTPNNHTNAADPFCLNRFVNAQESIYQQVLAELEQGRKQTHWMWYVFPQIDGLGHSRLAETYAIKNLEEAREYLRHPVLGARLRECTEKVIAVEGKSAATIFGHPDDLKFRSCMTLFACAAEAESAFPRALEKYFDGEKDLRTLALLAQTDN